MQKKQLICSALTAAMMLSTVAPSAGAARFSDSAGHWSESSINRWNNNGVIAGLDGEFNPNGAITRGEMATFIAGMLGLEETAPNDYPDLNGGWYTDAMLKCVAAGIMTGDDDGYMRPNDNITGAEIAVIMENALSISESGYSRAYPASGTGYVKPWAQGYVNALASRGISVGNDGGIFEPMENTSRAAVMAMFDRAVGTYITTPGTYTASGLTIINTPGTVRLRGTPTGVLVTEASSNVQVDISSMTINGKLESRASDAQLLIDDADVTGEIAVYGARSNVVVSGSSTLNGIRMDSNARNTSVSITKDVRADFISTSAPNNTISISGDVTTINMMPYCNGSTVDIRSGAVVNTYNSSADNITVSGSGTLKYATISGDNNRVDTKNTSVKLMGGATNTRVNGVLKYAPVTHSTSTSKRYYDSSHDYWYDYDYRVRFYLNYEDRTSDDLYKTRYVDRKDRVKEPTDPTRKGYDFMGWFTTSRAADRLDYDYEYDFDDRVTESFNLYAGWAKKGTTPSKPSTPTTPPSSNTAIIEGKAQLMAKFNDAGSASASGATYKITSESAVDNVLDDVATRIDQGTTSAQSLQVNSKDIWAEPAAARTLSDRAGMIRLAFGTVADLDALEKLTINVTVGTTGGSFSYPIKFSKEKTELEAATDAFTSIVSGNTSGIEVTGQTGIEKINSAIAAAEKAGGTVTIVSGNEVVKSIEPPAEGEESVKYTITISAGEKEQAYTVTVKAEQNAEEDLETDPAQELSASSFSLTNEQESLSDDELAARRAQEIIEAEAQRKAEEEAEAQRKAEEEAEAQRKAEEEAEAQRKAEEEAESQRKAEEEAEAQRKAEEEAEVQHKVGEGGTLSGNSQSEEQ